ncbi:MAG: non-heme iron oxygenase ferredoxin subunit [Granulosicoccus sp.]
MNEQSDLVKLIPLEELLSGKTKRVDHLGNSVLLCRVEDKVYAVDDMCTHEDISLSLGVLCEHRLRCPLHGSEFDVRTGKVLDEPAETDLSTYPVEMVDGWICL